MKEILKREYGISNEAELLEAFKASSGLDIGIFTMSLKGRSKCEEKLKKL